MLQTSRAIFTDWRIITSGISKHSKDFSESEVYCVIKKGFLSAEHKGYVTGKLELWINGKIYKLN